MWLVTQAPESDIRLKMTMLRAMKRSGQLSRPFNPGQDVDGVGAEHRQLHAPCRRNDGGPRVDREAEQGSGWKIGTTTSVLLLVTRRHHQQGRLAIEGSRSLCAISGPGHHQSRGAVGDGEKGGDQLHELGMGNADVSVCSRKSL